MRKKTQNSISCFGKRTLLTAAFMLSFAGIFPGTAKAAAQISDFNDSEIYITGFSSAQDAADQKLFWTKTDDNSMTGGYDLSYYFLLPACAKENPEVKIYFAREEYSYTTDGKLSVSTVPLDGYVYINNQQVENGDPITLPKSGESLSVRTANATYEIQVKQSAHLPAMFIQTKSGTMEYINWQKGNKEAADLLLLTEDGKTDCSASLKQIKGRGNSTWDYGKKPYNIKFDKKQNLLGMGKAKGWCLLANYLDPTLMRNEIIYNLAEEIGLDYTMDSRSIDLYLNGRYNGTYQLTEKIDIGETVVNITDLGSATEDVNLDANGEPLDLEKDFTSGSNMTADMDMLRLWQKNTQKWQNIANDPEDITGGYLIELELKSRYHEEACGFVSKRGQSATMKAPEFVSERQIKYIADFYQKMEDALYSEDGYNSEGKHFSEYIDVESVAKMYLLQEFAMNLDAGITSFYLYKDSDLAGDGKLHMAPVWDFDGALGNRTDRFYIPLTDPKRWYVNCVPVWEQENDLTLTILGKAFRQEPVRKRIVEYWNSTVYPAVRYLLGKNPEYTPVKLRTFDEYKAELSTSAQMNSLLWPIAVSKYHLGNINNGGDTYEGSVEFIRSFLKNRAEFMNSTTDTISNGFSYQASGYTQLNGTITISGTEQMKAGSVLTASVSSNSNEKDIVWQWMADGEAIKGADSPSYTVADLDAGKEISVVVRTNSEKMAGSIRQSAGTVLSGGTVTPDPDPTNPDKPDPTNPDEPVNPNVEAQKKEAAQKALQDVLTGTSAYGDSSKYEAASWKVYEEALAAAWSVLADSSASAEQLTAASQKLQSAIAALKPAATPAPEVTKPGKVKLSTVRNIKGKKARLVWKKASKADGYEIFRATKKKGKYKKVAVINKPKKVKYLTKKLKKGSTYFFKVRAYRKVNGQKVYGSWSNVKSVKIKK